MPPHKLDPRVEALDGLIGWVASRGLLVPVLWGTGEQREVERLGVVGCDLGETG